MRPRTIFKPTVFSLAGGLVPGLLLAQDTAVQQAKPASSYNEVMILMVSITLVFAFVIYALGQVLITLSRQSLQKNKAAKNVLPLTFLAVCFMFTNGSTAQDVPAAPVSTLVSSYGGMNPTAFWLLAGVMLIEMVAIAYILFFIKRIQVELMPPVEKVNKPALKLWWQRLDKKLFTRAVAVEQEADILLEHDYDGIRELDNSLPPWWKYGFIFTIIVSIVYMLNFHVFGGKNPTEEYQEELAQAQIQKELYEASNADKIDENNLQMPAAAGIEAGKEIFTTACWACHGKLGEGGAGPNLTDDYWLHKGSLNDIYTSIKVGYPDKGMQSWAKNFSPKEIANIAGYIKTLRGTNPAGAKAAQGDLFAADTADSTSNKADSSSAVATSK